MNKTGTYVWRDGRLLRISDKVPHKGTAREATLSFQEQVMRGYNRVADKGQRTLGTRAGIERIWRRAAVASA